MKRKNVFNDSLENYNKVKDAESNKIAEYYKKVKDLEFDDKIADSYDEDSYKAAKVAETELTDILKNYNIRNKNDYNSLLDAVGFVKGPEGKSFSLYDVPNKKFLQDWIKNNRVTGTPAKMLLDIYKSWNERTNSFWPKKSAYDLDKERGAKKTENTFNFSPDEIDVLQKYVVDMDRTDNIKSRVNDIIQSHKITKELYKSPSFLDSINVRVTDDGYRRYGNNDWDDESDQDGPTYPTSYKDANPFESNRLRYLIGRVRIA